MSTTATHTWVGPLVGSGTNPLSFNFQAISDTEVGVIKDGVEIFTGFTVARNPDGTGMITPTTSWTGAQVFIFSKPNWQNQMDFGRFDAWYPDQLTPPIDKLTRSILAMRSAIGVADVDVTTLAAGSPATVGVTQLPWGMFFEFGIPQGPQGLPGDPGVGLTDGDKGDITISGGGSTMTIDAGAVTLAKMANMATGSLLYRKTAGSGAPEVQSLATLKTDLGLTGTNSGDQTITLTGNVTGSGTGSFAATIANNAVGLAQMADVATGTVFYRKTAATGDPEVQTLATLKTDLGLTGTNSGDQTITLTGPVTGSGTGSFATTIAAGVVTLANMANMATSSLIYRKTAGSGAPEVNTLATLKTDLGLTGTNSGDQTSIVGITGTIAQFNAALTDGDFATGGGTATGTNTGDQTTITGNAGTATALQNSRNFSIGGSGITAAAVGFTGAANVVLAASVDAGHITLARMANLAANSIIGNNTGAGATPLALTGTQVTAMLDTVASGTKGLAPASGGGTANFLRADGTWAVPPGGGGFTPPTGTGFMHITGGSTDAAAKLVDTADINDAQVTLAKMANMATASLIYRKTAGSGAPEVNTLATLKTDLGLTGTNSGDQTSIAGITGTKAQFDTAVTDGNILFVGDVTQYSDELAQDAVGAMVDTTLVYTDATPLLSRAALTGDVTASAGSNATTIANNAVTLAKMADMATASFIGRVTASSGDPEVLSGTQATTLLDVFTTSLKGLAPASGGGTTNFLRADGSWAVPAGGSADGLGPDGNKGDITVGGTGTTLTINAGAVTLADMADMATGSLIYRKTAGSGAPEVQTLATLKTDLGLTGTNSGDQSSIVGITGTIAQFNTAVTDADLVPTGAATSSGLTMATARLLGRTTASAGAIEEISAGGNLTLSGGSLNLSTTAALATGVTAVTQAEGNNSTAIATTAYVDRLKGLVNNAGGATTLVIGQRGELYQATGNVTCPNAVFAAGDVIRVYNNSAASITIIQGTSVTMRLAGTATTGTRTLAQRGIADILYLSSSECVVSGVT